MKSIVLFSGGLDSTVLLCDRIAKWGKGEVGAISFDYGQKHKVELKKAVRLSIILDIEHMIVDINSRSRYDRHLFTNSGSSQVTSTPVPQGHYADPSMRTTFVPNRNMIMLSLASAWAISEKAEEVCFAAHAGDHTIYPDCRGDFIARFTDALFSGNYQPNVPLVEAPFIMATKADIVKRGYELKAPMELTWSCYEGREKHCGKCGTCVERKEAFELAGISDPTEYE